MEPPVLPDEVHSKDIIDLSKSFNMHGRSLKFLMNHETRQVSEELFENAFLNSRFVSPSNFFTNLMTHETHGGVVQAAEESYDNHIRIYSRPRENRSYSPSSRPELQGPVRQQDKYCSEQH